MHAAVRIAVVPGTEPALARAVVDGGGTLVDASHADGVVWTDPSDPNALRDLLRTSPATWVQLPFAGVESFVAAGVLDDSRTWTCAKGAYGRATAEHALALILAAARRLHRHARAAGWPVADENSPERRLSDATVLLVGTGGIGSALADMLRPLGPRLVAVNRSGRPLPAAERTEPVDALPELVAHADFVVVAAALTPATRALFDRAMFARMRREAWLVNVSRGGLVDTQALVDAVAAGQIAGAAVDVTDPEPLPADHPLWSMDDVLVTPHVANTWAMARPELAELVRRNVARFAGGEELDGVVDVAAGY